MFVVRRMRIYFGCIECMKKVRCKWLDYYNMIKIIGDYGVKFNQLKKVENEGEKLDFKNELKG